jgi:hypothetical protein
MFMGMFEPNEQVNIDKNVSWVLDNAKFIYDLISGLNHWNENGINNIDVNF